MTLGQRLTAGNKWTISYIPLRSRRVCLDFSSWSLEKRTWLLSFELLKPQWDPFLQDQSGSHPYQIKQGMNLTGVLSLSRMAMAQMAVWLDVGTIQNCARGCGNVTLSSLQMKTLTHLRAPSNRVLQRLCLTCSQLELGPPYPISSPKHCQEES